MPDQELELDRQVETDKPIWLDVERSIMKMGTTVSIFLPDETLRSMDRKAFRHVLSRFLNNLGDRAMEAYDKQQEKKALLPAAAPSAAPRAEER